MKMGLIDLAGVQIKPYPLPLPHPLWCPALTCYRWRDNVVTITGSGNASAVQPQLSFSGNNNHVDGWSYDDAVRRVAHPIAAARCPVLTC